MDCDRCDRGARWRKRLVGRTAAFVALVLIAFPSAYAFEPEMRVSNRRIAQGARLSIEVFVEGLSPDDIRVGSVDTPRVLTYLAGPDISVQAGSVRIAFAYSGREPGRAVFPSVEIVTSEQIVRTEPFVVEVSERNDPTRVPFDAAWRAADYSPFEGQTISLFLEMRDTRSFLFPDTITVTPPSSGLFQEVQGIGTIRSQTIGEFELLDVPIAAFLFTPSQAGNVTVPAAQVRSAGYTRTAPAITIAVQALPETVRGTGAVGNFLYSATIDTTELVEGESSVVTLTVEGTGNLEFLRMPGIEAEGTIVTEAGDVSRFAPNEAGYAGSRQKTYRVTPTRGGEYTVRVESFSYVERATGVVRTIPGRSFTVSVSGAGTLSESAAPEALHVLDAEGVKAVQPLNVYRRPVTYLFLLPGVVAVFVALFVRSRRKRAGIFSLAVFFLALGAPELDDSALNSAYILWSADEIEQSFRVYDEIVRESPDIVGVWYNRGVAAFSLGDTAEAVYSLRRALTANPHFGDARRALSTVESYVGLERQVEIRSFVHPDYSVLLLAIAFTIACVFCVAAIHRTRGGYVAAGVFFLTVAIGAAGLVPFGARLVRSDIAVVAESDLELKRVPADDTELWHSLPAGTAVTIDSEHEQFFLIRTGYGISGWVESASVLTNRRTR